MRRRCTGSQPCSRRRRRSRSHRRTCSGPWPDRTARLPRHHRRHPCRRHRHHRRQFHRFRLPRRCRHRRRPFRH
ncbi:pseudouridine synthase, partial [Pseudomonas aeruginosa]